MVFSPSTIIIVHNEWEKEDWKKPDENKNMRNGERERLSWKREEKFWKINIHMIDN